jgi:hypothetical protein
MAAFTKIAQLKRRKRALVLQNDLLREGLSDHLQNLQLASVWIEQGYSLAQMGLENWQSLSSNDNSRPESLWMKFARLVLGR